MTTLGSIDGQKGARAFILLISCLKRIKVEMLWKGFLLLNQFSKGIRIKLPISIADSILDAIIAQDQNCRVAAIAVVKNQHGNDNGRIQYQCYYRHRLNCPRLC